MADFTHIERPETFCTDAMLASEDCEATKCAYFFCEMCGNEYSKEEHIYCPVCDRKEPI